MREKEKTMRVAVGPAIVTTDNRSCGRWYRLPVAALLLLLLG